MRRINGKKEKEIFRLAEIASQATMFSRSFSSELMSSMRRSPKKLVRRQAEPLDYLFLRKTPGIFSMKISGVPYTWTFTVENVKSKKDTIMYDLVVIA